MKNVKLITVVALIAVVVVVGGIYWLTSISYHNQEAKLRNRFNAEKTSRDQHFDKMWKVIKDNVAVSDKYKDGFMQALIQTADARYGGKSPMFQWITEQNPAISAEVYNNLMNTISVERTAFMNKQDILIDVKREHDNLRTTAPADWFVGDKAELELIVITSTITQQAAKTGVDDRDLINGK